MLKLLLPQILRMIEMGQIGIDSTFNLRANILVSHVDINDIHSRMDLESLRILLLDDTPNLIDRERKQNTRDKLCTYRVDSFGEILRCDVSIADGQHGRRSPVQRECILDDPFPIFQRMPKYLQFIDPTTVRTFSIHRTSIIRDVEETAGSNITKHEDFNHEQD